MEDKASMEDKAPMEDKASTEVKVWVEVLAWMADIRSQVWFPEDIQAWLLRLVWFHLDTLLEQSRLDILLEQSHRLEWFLLEWYLQLHYRLPLQFRQNQLVQDSDTKELKHRHPLRKNNHPNQHSQVCQLLKLHRYHWLVHRQH